MKKLFILNLLFLISLITYSQITFDRTYNEGRGFSVQQTSDNGYIVTGIKFVNDTNHIIVFKTDEYGDLIWTKDYGVGEGRCIDQTSDGGYFIAGFKEKSDSTHMAIWFKTNDVGDIIWSKSYSEGYSDIAYSAEQTTDGGYIITGYTSKPDSLPNLITNLLLIKADVNGDTLWTKIYGGEYGSNGRCVKETEDGGYIVAGRKSNEFPYGNGYLIKTDENGDSIWTNYNGLAFFSVEQTSDGGYITSGCTLLYGGPAFVTLNRFNENGELLWYYQYGEPYFSFDNEVQQTVDGGIIVACTGGGLLKTNSEGDSLWMNYYGIEYASGHSVQQTSDGGYIMAGGTPGLVFLVKTDADGLLTWINEIILETEIDIYPNPSSTQITIELPHTPQKNTLLTIYNLNGQQFITQPITEPQTLVDVSGLPSGVYFVKVVDDDKVMMGKVVKE
jgi:hypothetical protein